MLPEHDTIWQPRDLEHTRDRCEQTPLTAAAQAVLDAAVTWEQAESGTYKGSVAQERDLRDAIRRYREEGHP